MKPVILKRTFNMMGHRFWRIMSPWHPNYQSDLSLAGLKQWGILSVAVFVPHAWYFLYMFHGRVAAMASGLC